MQFDSFQSFLLMDGHGAYVWAVYGIVFILFALLLIAPLRKKRQFFARQIMLQKRLNREDGNLSSS